MIPCYIFTARYFVIILYRDYIVCIMCLNFDRLETVIVYVLIKFCSVLFMINMIPPNTCMHAAQVEKVCLLSLKTR